MSSNLNEQRFKVSKLLNIEKDLSTSTKYLHIYRSMEITHLFYNPYQWYLAANSLH